MPRPLTLGCCAAVVGLATLSPAASADTPSGGATYQARPSVTKFECVNGEAGRCPQGELLRVRGEGLQQAVSVLFLGRDGRKDDRVARADKRSPHRVIVRVPPDATTGPVRVKSRDTGLSRPSRRLRVLAAVVPGGRPLPVVPVGEGVFPVRDTYDFGTEINGFGGGRGHRGQDLSLIHI